MPNDADAPLETVTVVVHREPRWKWLAVPTLMIALGATCLAASVSLPWAGFLLAGIFGYLRSKAHGTSSRLMLEVTNGDLVIEAAPNLSGRHLLHAVQGAEPEQLVFTGDDGSTLEVRARNAAEASSLLSALRRPGTVVSGRVPALGDLIALTVATLALSAAIFVVAPPILWVLGIAAPAAMVAWIRSLQQIIAGKDGIVVRSLRNRARRRFVPYAEVARVADRAVVTKNNEVIPLAPDVITAAFDPSRRISVSALEEEVRRGVACAEENAKHAGPSLESALASPSDVHGGFREVSIPEEDLWQLLERHDTTLDLRTRAAEVLRGRVAPAELRIRVAELARSSAHVDTRDALYRIATEEETAAGEAEAEATDVRRRASA